MGEDELTLLGASRTVYPNHPDLARLETFPNPSPESYYTVLLDCPEFTSLCPKTGQPDFGTIRIHYIPDQRVLESKSLKLYLFSFRQVGMFYEQLVTRICRDLVREVRPKWIEVTGTMMPRGGISLEARAEWPEPEER